MPNKFMKIIIVGKGGSGKDYLKNKFVKQGLRPATSHTTRPPREGEVDMKDYFFINKVKFSLLVETNFFQEFDEFNGWFYGTSKNEWGCSDVFIKTPKGVSQISPEDRKNCFIIYLDISHNVRYERLEKRSDADSVMRRIKADKKDFAEFTDYDLRITNPDF